jgi:hypothetical protein
MLMPRNSRDKHLGRQDGGRMQVMCIMVLAMIGSKVIARFTAEGLVEAVPLPFFYNCILLGTCMPAWKINVQVVKFSTRFIFYGMVCILHYESTGAGSTCPSGEFM